MTWWPKLTRQRAAALKESLPEPDDLVILAARISTYPGGGGQAHLLRSAAREIAQVREWLDDA